jgi:signal transduction histidine kinase
LGLRLQLLLISLFVLLLPWAGCQYVRATESALRDAQADLLLTTARGLAPSLEPALPAAPGGDAEEAIYLHPLTTAPIADGFVDDWRLVARPRPAIVGGARLAVLGAEFDGAVWLFAHARAAANSRLRFDLAIVDPDGELRLISLAPGAPGALTDDDVTGFDVARRVSGYWLPVPDGYRMELRLPARLVGARLGISVSGDGFEAATYRGTLPGRVVRQDRRVADVLGRASLPGLRALVVDAEGWIVAVADNARVSAPGERAPRDGGAGLYRALLGERERLPTLPDDTPRIGSPFVLSALAGNPASARLAPTQADADRGRFDDALVAVAVPLHAGGRVTGALVLQQDSAEILTLSHASLIRLTNVMLGLVAGAILLLLAYATWLSWRIRRLGNAVERALDRHGRIRVAMPGVDANDEIGGLSRSFDRLLARVGEQQDYLRALASTLSHELRTPIAVVSSSLDNLEHEALTPVQAELTGRASEGVTRLQTILNAMSAANRTEEAVRDAELVEVALPTLLAQLREAYESAFASHCFTLVAHDDITLRAAPELLTQMLDKLIENAVSFAPPGSEIGIRLRGGSGMAQIDVTNEGPPLPAGFGDRLFDSMVSVRAAQPGTHLGLGLYIARLIAEAHGGRIRGVNEPADDGSGRVRITVTLAA